MNKNTLVIKVGTSTLLGENEQPSSVFMNIAKDISFIKDSFNIVLVSSGAIGFGVRLLGQKKRPMALDKLQALSCIGQPALMAHWQKAFGDVVLGQALTTNHELEDKSEEKKLIKATHALWGYGTVPIFNENDALADTEIKVGDNDSLAAHIARHLNADALVLLSDIEGVYENFGKKNQRLLREITLSQAEKHVDQKNSAHGTGGLATKIKAAQLMQTQGAPTYLASAWQPLPVSRVLKGEIGTKFVVH